MAIRLSDAQNMAARHPGTFRAPDASRARSLSVGEIVKLSRPSARFWVRITRVAGPGRYAGVPAFPELGDVDRQVRRTTRLSFSWRNIYEFY